MRKIFFYITLLLIVSACKKSEIEQVPLQNGPFDQTLTTTTIENYITRTYILTIGREPSTQEFNSARTLLTSALLDSASRQIFLDSIFTDSDYRPYVYEENRYEFLNNIDTSKFSDWIYIFQLFQQDPTYHSQWPYFEYEENRMIELRNAYVEYINKNIEVNELQLRMCNNFLTDSIHPSATDFIDFTFLHFINRIPTLSEQQAGMAMLDSSSAILFLQTGSSKEDYLNIMVHNSNYFEAQVVKMYLKYLNRIPSTIELFDGKTKYFTTGDYTAVQRDILSSNEFIGL